jgi:AcrR family transcriptional regulator
MSQPLPAGPDGGADGRYAVGPHPGDAGVGAPVPLPAAQAAGGAGRRTARGDRTRSRILVAARTAFRGVGWHRARVEDVCREAGIGHGTYYAYFANKAAVLEALVREHAAALYGLAEAPWTSGDVRADVRTVIDGFVSASEADRDIRSLWFAAAPSEPDLAALVDEVRRQFVARIRTNLVGAVDAGVGRAELDVDVAATALAAMVEQTVQLYLGGIAVLDPSAGRLDRERVVDTLTDLWVAAVYR